MSGSNIIGMGALGLSLRPLIPRQIELVFFCVKAFDLKNALLSQDAMWSTEVPFVTLSNGYLGGVLTGLKLPSSRPLRTGVTTIGGFFDESGVHQAVNQEGHLVWGPCVQNETPRDISPTAVEVELLKLNPSWKWVPSPDFHQMQKWIMNVVVNSITAANRLRCNGDLQGLWGEVLETMREALILASRLWPKYQDQLLGESSRVTYEGLLSELIKKTSQNENSMARDVRLSRRTESEFLAGMAMPYGDLPNLKALHLKIESTKLAR